MGVTHIRPAQQASKVRHLGGALGRPHREHRTPQPDQAPEDAHGEP
jgi:hypothetical protein